MRRPHPVPLAASADEALWALAAATASKAIAELDGAAMLCQRAVLGGMAIPGRTSAGGSCRLFDAIGGTVALNLARPADRELLPALFEADDLNVSDDEDIAACIAASEAERLLSRGRMLGLAIATVEERLPSPLRPCTELVAGLPITRSARSAPRVLDLSALWAGPLAAHLLLLAGAEVIKVESCTRPDATRWSNPAFHALLNQGKRSVTLDLTSLAGREALLSLIAASDIVIESARPRALMQLGIDAGRAVRTTPGLIWITITAHGAEGDASGWVGFGDDCGVAGGLSAALREATGHTGFVGDAMADPLTGVFAATAAWEAWMSGRGARIGLAMSHVVAGCLQNERTEEPALLDSSLRAWSDSIGQPFRLSDTGRARGAC
jgi:hypothetical protein